MLKVDRHNLIEKELNLKGSVTISECAKLLNVSEETVRRDFREMESQNRLTRIHGGAYKEESDDKNVPIHLREVLFLDEKIQMAKYAFNHYINENDTIMIDSSTTCYQLAKMILLSDLHVTIITNSLKIMQLFDTNGGNCKLIAIGGQYRRKSCSFVGEYALEEIGSFYADKCFISTSVLDRKHGLLDSSALECYVHKKYLENSEKQYVLADHTKFDDHADYIVSDWKNIHTVITDCDPGSEWNEMLNNMEVLIKF